MAVYYRMQVAVWHDSILARDATIINPCFKDNGATSNPQNLCDSLVTAISPMITNPTSHQIRVRAYDLQGTKPVHFAAEKLANSSQSGAAAYPRELAVCLSFYSGENVPRKRGRLYIPYHWWGASPVGLRPSSGDRTAVANFVGIFASLGGVDVDWIVWSEADNTGRKVSNYWVDDEWDIQRSRGLRPTTRTVGTTGG